MIYFFSGFLSKDSFLQIDNALRKTFRNETCAAAPSPCPLGMHPKKDDMVREMVEQQEGD